MKAIKQNVILFLALILLGSCASSYKSINPKTINYVAHDLQGDLSLSYKYDILQEYGNKKYAKKEDKDDDEEENRSIVELNPFNYITNNTIVSISPKPIESQSAKSNYYEVKKGDTLFNIAQRFDVTIETLKKWNKMATANIQLGQKLLIERLNANE